MRINMGRYGLLVISSAIGSLLLTGLIPCPGLAEPDAQLLQQFPQAQGMAGYVLNAETNINRTYSRQLEQQLLPSPPSSNVDQDEPLIQFQGPPPRRWDQPHFLLNAPKPNALRN